LKQAGEPEQDELSKTGSDIPWHGFDGVALTGHAIKKNKEAASHETASFILEG
jgi:hypothetical protein